MKLTQLICQTKILLKNSYKKKMKFSCVTVNHEKSLLPRHEPEPLMVPKF